MKRLLVLTCLASLTLVGCKLESPKVAPPVAAGTLPGKPLEGKPEVKTASGLAYYELREGTGPAVVSGQSVTVHYTGYLENGSKFDSSVDRGDPFNFGLGQGSVIKGWDEGVAGMKAGGMRKLVIPSTLGYGAGGKGPIPPNATMIFDVELISFR